MTKHFPRPIRVFLACCTIALVVRQILWSQHLQGCWEEAGREKKAAGGGNGRPQASKVQQYRVDSSPQITTSPISKRRFVATVTSMPDAFDRRALFFDTWKKAWPDFHIFPTYSFKNHANLMGYALLAVNVLAMQKAMEFSNATGENFDYLIILEDDALPFVDTTWPADLDKALDDLEAKGGGGLYLGCHAVYSWERQKLISQNGSIGSAVASIVWAYGSYAWMIPRKSLDKLYEYFATTLQNKVGMWDGASDTSAHSFFRDMNVSHYAAVPLLVDHQSRGSSKTFVGTEMDGATKSWYTFEGHRDWWNFEDSIGIFQPSGLPRMNNKGETWTDRQKKRRK